MWVCVCERAKIGESTKAVNFEGDTVLAMIHYIATSSGLIHKDKQGQVVRYTQSEAIIGYRSWC